MPNETDSKPEKCPHGMWPGDCAECSGWNDSLAKLRPVATGAVTPQATPIAEQVRGLYRDELAQAEPEGATPMSKIDFNNLPVPSHERRARMCRHFAQEIELICVREPRELRLDKIVTVMLAASAQLTRLAGEPEGAETAPIKPIGELILKHPAFNDWLRSGYASQESDGLWLHYAAICEVLRGRQG